MESEGLSLLATGVWIIPLVMIGTLAGLYLWGRRARQLAEQEIKGLGKELRRYHSSASQLRAALREHSPSDPEPYGEQARELEAQLNAINGRVASLETHYVQIKEQLSSASTNYFQWVLGAPVLWYMLRKDLAGLRKGLADGQPVLARAQQVEGKLAGIAWDTALQARQERARYQKTSQALDELRAHNVQGAAIDAALLQDEQIQANLAQIPPFFLEAEQPVVLSRADKQSVIRVKELTSTAAGQLNELEPQLETWQAGYAAAVQRVSEMLQALEAAGQALNQAQGALILDDYTKQLDGLNQIAKNLQATLSRLEAESMESVIQEAGRVKQAAEDVVARLGQARQGLVELGMALAGLNEGLRDLSAQFAALGVGRVYPVGWQQGKTALTELSRQVNGLGSAQKPRTPEQVEQDLANANQQSQALGALVAHCQQVAAQHTELLNLLEAQEIIQGPDWFQDAEALLAQVEVYDPENWPKADGVVSFGADLEASRQALKSLAIADASRPVSEDQLAGRLEQARQLVLVLKSLRGRASNIQGRLGEIQRLERQASQQLDAAQKTLGQIGFLARSNAFLQGLAGQEIKRQQGILQTLSSELDDPAHGVLDRKAKQTAAFVASLEGSTHKWREALGKEAQSQAQALSAALVSLDAIALLDEPAVAEARQLLSSGAQFTTTPKSAPETDELILDLKRRSEYCQSCSAALRKLQEVEKPVVESFQAAKKARQSAQEQLADLAPIMRQRPSWPPSSVNLEQESQEFKQLEGQWEALKNGRTNALSLVQQLGNLNAGYQALGEKARRAVERSARDQQQVGRIEEEIQEYTGRWRSLGASYRQNEIANQEIAELLNTTEQGLNRIQADYRQRKIDYDQSLQELNKVLRRLRLAQIQLDETHVVDANGRVITNREA